MEDLKNYLILKEIFHNTSKKYINVFYETISNHYYGVEIYYDELSQFLFKKILMKMKLNKFYNSEELKNINFIYKEDDLHENEDFFDDSLMINNSLITLNQTKNESFDVEKVFEIFINYNEIRNEYEKFIEKFSLEILKKFDETTSTILIYNLYTH